MTDVRIGDRTSVLVRARCELGFFSETTSAVGERPDYYLFGRGVQGRTLDGTGTRVVLRCSIDLSSVGREIV